MILSNFLFVPWRIFPGIAHAPPLGNAVRKSHVTITEASENGIAIQIPKIHIQYASCQALNFASVKFS